VRLLSVAMPVSVTESVAGVSQAGLRRSSCLRLNRCCAMRAMLASEMAACPLRSRAVSCVIPHSDCRPACVMHAGVRHPLSAEEASPKVCTCGAHHTAVAQFALLRNIVAASAAGPE